MYIVGSKVHQLQQKTCLLWAYKCPKSKQRHWQLFTFTMATMVGLVGSTNKFGAGTVTVILAHQIPPNLRLRHKDRLLATCKRCYLLVIPYSPSYTWGRCTVSAGKAVIQSCAYLRGFQILKGLLGTQNLWGCESLLKMCPPLKGGSSAPPESRDLVMLGLHYPQIYENWSLQAIYIFTFTRFHCSC